MRNKYYTIEQLFNRIKGNHSYVYNIFFNGDGFMIAEADGPTDEAFFGAGYEFVGGYHGGGLTFSRFVEDCNQAKADWEKRRAA